MAGINFIIEGVDRLGKDTLIENLQIKLGPHIVQHYGKPIVADKFKDHPCPEQKAQKESFKLGFDLLRTGIPTIMNRFHIGEYIYGPMYRFYNAEYIFELEDKYFTDTCHNDRTLLVLLTTSNFDFIVDDGESFDFSKKEQEQRKFIDAVKKSNIGHKVIVDVHNGSGGFKTPEKILNEILEVYNEIRVNYTAYRR